MASSVEVGGWRKEVLIWPAWNPFLVGSWRTEAGKPVVGPMLDPFKRIERTGMGNASFGDIPSKCLGLKHFHGRYER